MATLVISAAFFCVGLVFFIFGTKQFHRIKASEPAAEATKGQPEETGTGQSLEMEVTTICREIIPKIDIVINQQEKSSNRIEKATVKAIGQFNNLLEHLEKNANSTAEIVDGIKGKISEIVTQTDSDKTEDEQLTAIRDKYEEMLEEVMEQLSMIIERKTDDIHKLDEIRTRIQGTSHLSQGIDKIARILKILAINAKIQSVKAGEDGRGFSVVADEVGKLALQTSDKAAQIDEEVASTTQFIHDSITALEDAMTIESQFINSTIILLKDIVLSVVNSFVHLSQTLEGIMGESSSFKDQVQQIIVVNLQFEDIYRQMTRHTVDILNQVNARLYGIQACGKIDSEEMSLVKEDIIKETDQLFTMASERDYARDALDVKPAKTDPPASETRNFPPTAGSATGGLPEMKIESQNDGDLNDDDDDVTFF